MSSAARGWFGRRPRMWISREAVDAGLEELRGDLAHEYSHLLDRKHRRDTILRVTGWFALATPAVGALTVYPQVASNGGADRLVFAAWFAGWLLLFAAVGWTAFFSHRIELRADRTAAELLGSAGPLLAMLDRLEAVRSDYGPMQRFQARLTHPDPVRRQRAFAA